MSNTVETVDVTSQLDEEKFPEVPRQVDGFVELQRGLLNHATGVWERFAEVRELTGFDEERIAAITTRKGITYIEYFTEILKLGVMSIGSIEFKSRLDELTIGDRNLLFLAIIRTTYGRQRSFEHTCTECKEPNMVTVDLYDDFEIQTPDFDPTETLKVTLKDGTIHEMRPPTAEDTIIISKKHFSGAEQTSAMIARCSVWRENPPKDPDIWAKSLNMADRNTIVKTLSNIKMGPKMDEVSVPCAHCGANLPVLIDWIFLILG